MTKWKAIQNVTKTNLLKFLEEDEIREENESNEEEEISSSNEKNKLKGIANLMDLDEELLFNEIPSKDMINDKTIRKHCQNMWDEYFKDKSILDRHNYLSSYLGENIWDLFRSCWVLIIWKTMCIILIKK